MLIAVCKYKHTEYPIMTGLYIVLFNPPLVYAYVGSVREDSCLKDKELVVLLEMWVNDAEAEELLVYYCLLHPLFGFLSSPLICLL